MVEVRVLPSPVFISAMFPWCSAIAPITWTSKCRCPIVRLAASRTHANASGNRSSRVSPDSSRSRNSVVLAASSGSDRSSSSGSYVLTSPAVCPSCFFLRPSPICPSFSMTMLRLGVGEVWNLYGTGGLEPDRSSRRLCRPRPGPHAGGDAEAARSDDRRSGDLDHLLAHGVDDRFHARVEVELLH